ncbi:hypothetical protein RSOLAG1IB_06951 [Rhizoctonia solani AG-1 IB]|uniref:Uncharacterized protein n=1 Tax=Thanatephorus cucumeris (strain AG1-IB / isolate 7/3/14) TaxID=1108050 RepID=A0A0B7FDN7_THACB|nr:hypothetical protein RSOLAG1IB_06951 [Rhizoctonia solani AG-1 IB]
MVHTPAQAPFVQIIPLAGYPTTSYVRPSLDHHYSLRTPSGSQDYATAPRRNSQSTIGVTTERPCSNRGHTGTGYQPAICERRASKSDTSCYPYLSAEHAAKEAHASVRPTARFETVASPKRKAHYVPYVPATPPRSPERVPTPPGLNIPPRASGWNPYPSPPNSPPSERAPGFSRKYTTELPKQSYIPSPPPSPKHRSTPRPKAHVPMPSPYLEDEMKEGDELLSKFRRFALAARETPSDEKCIEDLMESYDELMPSLIEEVAIGPHVEFD